ncbi:ABC transporter ATP-binding protein [Actinoplanes sp. SE50]|uniref:nickel ABC transporter ATP-binding protein NikE n=1 Tax=unclassified Actinoplanes TaxID=2626549 RepID=UPI00023EBB50|nr:MULTISPECIES: ABC transporter ATP-binding protein [unclassified Actinoplanes]AEV83416.1 Glutathione import ATP-binding protein gsiA [Actinoplanes sp. SE50/110]ATO81809.1 ABC transporter ATP-binding protein [Actinoplanes sp. SE50]SLL99217.1 ABC transporter ATP-binding protein [Actinoplanes sp. SE50/110]
MINVEDLTVTFHLPRRTVEAVRGVSFDIEAGECVAIVGESGSGKSVTARSLLGLAGPGARVQAARLEVDGRDARRFAPRDWRRLRGGFAGLVLQDALVSLDPLRTVGAEIAEVLRVHGQGSRAGRTSQAHRLLRDVHVPEPERRATQYPHQLSGGLRQRALIATALAGGPKLLIADEPTTALDATVQAQILTLLAERRAAGETLLLISHDLAVVSRLADRVLVMKDGRIVESGPTRRLLTGADHAYTRQLIAAASGRKRTADTAPGPVVAEARALRKVYGDRAVVRDVDVTIARGEIVGLVGESGSGKTTVAQLLFGLVEPTSGQVRFEGSRFSGVPERARRPLRRRLQFIAQDPLSAFDPRWTVRRIVAEALPRGADVVPVLERVGLGADVLDRYPRQLSGGQRQRVAIARAIAPRPSLIICDEPVSALDVSVQAQVLDLLADIRETDGTALLFISHDLGVIRDLADRVLVMRDGRVVEQGPVKTVFDQPTDDYTRQLLAAVPTLEVLP